MKSMSIDKSAAILRQIKTLGKSILPKDSSLWLYGSRARGTAHPNSDWDFLILLNKDKTEFEDYGKYAFPIAMLGAEFNQEITPQIYTKKQWEEMSFTPFYKNVEQDKKVILWD